MAETEDLKSFQCRFESDRGHQLQALTPVGYKHRLSRPNTNLHEYR